MSVNIFCMVSMTYLHQLHNHGYQSVWNIKAKVMAHDMKPEILLGRCHMDIKWRDIQRCHSLKNGHMPTKIVCSIVTFEDKDKDNFLEFFDAKPMPIYVYLISLLTDHIICIFKLQCFPSDKVSFRVFLTKFYHDQCCPFFAMAIDRCRTNIFKKTILIYK